MWMGRTSLGACLAHRWCACGRAALQQALFSTTHLHVPYTWSSSKLLWVKFRFLALGLEQRDKKMRRVSSSMVVVHGVVESLIKTLDFWDRDEGEVLLGFWGSERDRGLKRELGFEGGKDGAREVTRAVEQNALGSLCLFFVFLSLVPHPSTLYF